MYHQPSFVRSYLGNNSPGCFSPANYLVVFLWFVCQLCFSQISLAAENSSIAVLDFEYKDTSGEVRDQTSEHQRLLTSFMSLLRSELVNSYAIKVVPLNCGSNACSLQGSSPLELMKIAKNSGADYLLLGNISKMSSLVQLGSYHLLNTRTNKPELDRILTFRGDNDQDWQRAAQFLAKTLGLHINQGRTTR